MLISVIIPLYNEEQTIGNIIERVQTTMKHTGLKYEIIVVDDCSFDNSCMVAKKYPVQLYSLSVHVGKGAGLRAGFAKAKGDFIVTIDSDGSHLPEELPRLLYPVLNNKADLVIGSRYLLQQKKVTAKKLNVFGVKIFNSIIQMFAGVYVTDSQSGYRVMKKEVLDIQHLKSCGYEIETEMLVKTAKSHYRVFEVPISFEQRTYGVSGIDYLHDFFRIFVSIISARLRRV
ncbi:MAG: glycosyltransferase family 2 protein [Candidatus Bathyarchaeota archaeon]|nr:glycosyltransferase family 2 protein [Candidatus Termiticorpusculum sp.]